MTEFKSLYFSSPEEKKDAIIKTKEILESVNMPSDGIQHFLNNDELIWNVCSFPEQVFEWEDNPYNSPLSEENEYRVLALVLTEIS